MNMAGSILPTFIFFSPSIFIPMAPINRPPTADISFKTSGVSKSLTDEANKVIVPWYRKTASAEKPTPMPRVEANIIEDMPSKMDLAKRVLLFP